LIAEPLRWRLEEDVDHRAPASRPDQRDAVRLNVVAALHEVVTMMWWRVSGLSFPRTCRVECVLM
jgi:hypothetical protein